MGTADIKNSAVTTAKIKVGAVATARLKDGAVSAIKLQDGSVRNAKIGNGSVSKNKLSLGVRDIINAWQDTQYLALAGGQCVHKNPENISATNQPFYCDLSDNVTALTDAFWSVNLPNGATVTGIKITSFSDGGDTSCELRRGSNLSGSVLATVTKNGANWTTTSESFLAHTVDNSDAAYAVRCFTSNNTTGLVGSINITYLNPGVTPLF